MKITLVGPGENHPIPPIGWGAVEILIWDNKNILEKMGHKVQIVNTSNRSRIIEEINQFNPDFVHIHYDDMIDVYPYINYPRAISSHFGYLEQPNKFNGYEKLLNQFLQIQPNIFCHSPGIYDTYRYAYGIPNSKLFLTSNGVRSELFRYSTEPVHSDKSIYVAKVDYRKRQHLFQSISSLYYAGNCDYPSFNKNINYLGEWNKQTLYESLTDFGNLVLLSDGENHALVCMEALAAGLGVVVSEYATAHLDLSKNFITVIPEEKINDIEYIEDKIIKNREYSVKNREEIKQYSKVFEWETVIKKLYLPSVERIIENA